MSEATLSRLTKQEALVIAAFQQRPVRSMAWLRSTLDLSRMTIFRALSKHGYVSSFNRNGRFYTLAERPCFDDNGLWFYRSLGFSRHRTLPATLVALVHQARAGLTAEELEALLRTTVGNLLPRLANEQQLARRRLGRCAVYLAVDAVQQEQQWQQRQLPQPTPMAPEGLPDEVPVELLLPFLVEWIRCPHASLQQVRCRLHRQGLLLSAQQAQTAVDHFQLEKKQRSGRKLIAISRCIARILLHRPRVEERRDVSPLAC